MEQRETSEIALEVPRIVIILEDWRSKFDSGKFTKDILHEIRSWNAMYLSLKLARFAHQSHSGRVSDKIEHETWSS